MEPEPDKPDDADNGADVPADDVYAGEDDTGRITDDDLAALLSDSDANDGEITEAEVISEGAITRERDDYLDAWRRTQADFENYRKRSMKQQADSVDYATGRLVEDLLPVLDACEAGIEHGDEGVTAVFAALLGSLEKSGLVRLDPVGEMFDPNRHEAVMHETSEEDLDEPVVAEVMRPGYTWKGRVVRAAMVKVKS